MVSAVKPVSEPAQSVASAGTGPVHAKATHVLPDRPNPLSQVCSHFAAVQASARVRAVSAVKPESSPAHSVAFAGANPVQEKVCGMHVDPDWMKPLSQVYSHFAEVQRATRVREVSAVNPVSSPAHSVAFAGADPVQLNVVVEHVW